MKEEKNNLEFPFNWIEVLDENKFENAKEAKLKEEERKLVGYIRKKYPNSSIEDIKFYRLWVSNHFEYHHLNNIIDFLVIKINGKFYITSMGDGFSALLKYSNLIKQKFNKIDFEISQLSEYEEIVYEIMNSAPALRIIEETMVTI